MSVLFVVSPKPSILVGLRFETVAVGAGLGIVVVEVKLVFRSSFYSTWTVASFVTSGMGATVVKLRYLSMR